MRGLQENIELEILHGKSWVVNKTDALSQGALDPYFSKCDLWTSISIYIVRNIESWAYSRHTDLEAACY